MLEEAKGRSSHVCPEMSALVSCYGSWDRWQREFWVAGYPFWWCSVMTRSLRAEWSQSDAGICYGVCATGVERPCLCVRRNASACGVADSVHTYLLLEGSWKSEILESGLGPVSGFVSLTRTMRLSVFWFQLFQLKCWDDDAELSPERPRICLKVRAVQSLSLL